MKTMRLSDFILLGEKEKKFTVLHQGILVGKREKDDRKVFLFQLENIINDRYEHPKEDSYVNRLREKGLNKIAQKVGEEGVETVIAALPESREDLINEASDLVFHLLVLLREKNLSLKTIAANLEQRHQ